LYINSSDIILTKNLPEKSSPSRSSFLSHVKIKPSFNSPPSGLATSVEEAKAASSLDIGVDSFNM